MLNVCHIFWALILGQISWISVFNSVSDFSCRLSACGQIAVTIWEMSPLLSLPCLTAPTRLKKLHLPVTISLSHCHLAKILPLRYFDVKIPYLEMKATTFNFGLPFHKYVRFPQDNSFTISHFTHLHQRLGLETLFVQPRILQPHHSCCHHPTRPTLPPSKWLAPLLFEQSAASLRKWVTSCTAALFTCRHICSRLPPAVLLDTVRY